MEVREYFSEADSAHWLEEIGKSDWEAGGLLYRLLRDGQYKDFCGATARVFLLTDGQRLASFCTLAELDDVRDADFGPWIGFVYTFPAYRGHRYAGELIRYAEDTARAEGAAYAYISTGWTGLYEKYGYAFFRMMKEMNGEDSRVYRKALR